MPCVGNVLVLGLLLCPPVEAGEMLQVQKIHFGLTRRAHFGVDRILPVHLPNLIKYQSPTDQL